MNEQSFKKLDELKKTILKLGSAAIAFSGGIDSSFLLKTAHDMLHDKVIAITVVSSCFPKKEITESTRFIEKQGISQILINVDINEIDNFTDNPTDRCYHCKKTLFNKIKKIAHDHDIDSILEGSNADDSQDYRPGSKAIKELGIISPLKEIGFTKKEIRSLSKKLGITSWDKSSSACLASRIPYGTKITKSRLLRIEQAEEILHQYHINQCRVRYHNELASIEVLKENFSTILNHSETISKQFKKLGFRYTTLDIQGYRTGSLNEGINNGKIT